MTVRETDGVRVRKALDADEFPVPAVRFDVESERDEPVMLTLTDQVPEELSMSQVGFHPEYGNDYWTAHQENEVTFRRRLEAGESLTTVYGVRFEEGDVGPEADLFSDAPEVVAVPVDEYDAEVDEAVVEEATMADIAPPERTEVVREVIGGERESVPGLEADDDPLADVSEADGEDGPDDDPLADPLAEVPGDEDGVDQSADVPDDEGFLPDPATPDDADETEPTSAAEAEESEGDALPLGASDDAEVEVDGEDVDAETTDEAVTAADPVGSADPDAGAEGDGDGDDPVAVEADEESDADPDATDDAPEDVSDDASPAASQNDDLVARLADELRGDDASEDDLAVVREALAEADGVVTQQKSTSVRLDHLQARLGEIDAYADALEEFIDENGTARELLAELREDVEAVETEQETLREDVETMADELEGDVDRLRDDLEAVETRLSGVEDAEQRIGSVEDELDSLEETLESVEAWRDQLSDAFGT